MENIEQMGSSGETHFDAFEFSRAFTNVISVPDLPDGMDPGSLFFLLAGICVCLDPYVSINLSALHLYGGTPLIVPKGTKLKDWETRCTNANAYTEFSCRELALLVNFNVMQMDKRVDARLDIDAFIKSLSFEFDGTRRTTQPWIQIDE